jgi:Alpha/beta hydrolase domain
MSASWTDAGWARLVRGASALIAGALAWALSAAAPVDAAVTFSGPLGSTGAKLHAPAETAQFPLAPYGYTEQEYLVSGTAQGNLAGYPQNIDYAPLPFTTRIIVRRPLGAKRSNGTLVLEWMNVSLQQDTDVDWIEGYRELLHAGFTYVAVSVQPTGVPLSSEDPVRYGQIHIPPYAAGVDSAAPSQGGPSYGESIFTQIAHALKSAAGAGVLGGAPARRVIAVGESQSAERLSCYLLDAKPIDPVFDAFMIDHGECAGPTAGASTPFAYAPRTPTMFLDGMAESRPGMHNGPDLRVWEIAGASHVDAWIGAYGLAEHNWDDTGTPQSYSEQAAGNWGLEGGQGGVCNLFTSHDPVRADELPQQYTHDAALAALQTWITTGRAPAVTPSLKFDPKGTASPDGAGGGVDADRFGNALGGLRLPQIQVPVAQYQGTCTNPEGQLLIGTTRPFTDAQLLALYPTFATYRTKMCQASLADIRQGTLLPFDAQDIDRRVELGRTRWPAGKQGNGTSGKTCAALYAARTAPKRRRKSHHRRPPPHRRASAPAFTG